ARRHFTPALPIGQVRRTAPALHGVEDRGPGGRPLRAEERRRVGGRRPRGPRERRPRHGARRRHERARARRRHQGPHHPPRQVP
ncbi:MAG: UDP-N-acetylenolpyruvoylglucosamine reductase, partial [uncultured Rubrobacteraceae bacterium]